MEPKLLLRELQTQHQLLVRSLASIKPYKHLMRSTLKLLERLDFARDRPHKQSSARSSESRRIRRVESIESRVWMRQQDTKDFN